MIVSLGWAGLLFYLTFDLYGLINHVANARARARAEIMDEEDIPEDCSDEGRL